MRAEVVQIKCEIMVICSGSVGMSSVSTKYKPFHQSSLIFFISKAK